MAVTHASPPTTKPDQHPRRAQPWQRAVTRGIAGSPSAMPHGGRFAAALPEATRHAVAHVDAAAQAACHRLGVEGFTLGNHVAFDRPNPRPRVVAHELTHVAQHQSRPSSFVRTYTESRLGTTTFRVSDNLDVAVAQDPTNPAGTQLAYATPDLIDSSSLTLGLLDSDVEMFSDSTDTLPLDHPDPPVAELERVRILRNSGTDAADQQLWPTDCQLAAHFVTGAFNANQRLRVRTRDQVPTTIDPSEHPAIQAARVFIALYPEDVDIERFDHFVEEATIAEATGDSDAFDLLARTALDTALEPYAELATTGEFTEEDAESAGIDRHALPQLGEAYGILTAGRPATTTKRTWNYHFAGVIMISGDDRMTLENYQAGVDLGDNWKLQLYGTAKGQTFHDQHAATQQHGTLPTTAVFTQPDLSDLP